MECTLTASSVQKCHYRRIHIAFNTDIKSKDLLNALKNSSLHVIRYIRHPNDQALFKIHVLHARKFCRRSTSERKSVSWSKVPRGSQCLGAKSLLGIDWTCVCVH